MPSETVIAVAGSVTALAQLCKFWGVPNKYGPYIVFGLSPWRRHLGGIAAGTV